LGTSPSDRSIGLRADSFLQTDFEINHAISYAHYVSSLPLTSTYLSKALPRLKTLLNGLLAQGAIPLSDNSPSSSEANFESPGSGTVPQSQLCEGLLRALFWVGWGVQGLRGEVAELVDDLLCQVEDMMKSRRNLSTSISFF
jgi:phosphatidylinositol 4-kinase